MNPGEQCEVSRAGHNCTAWSTGTHSCRNGDRDSTSTFYLVYLHRHVQCCTKNSVCLASAHSTAIASRPLQELLDPRLTRVLHLRTAPVEWAGMCCSSIVTKACRQCSWTSFKRLLPLPLLLNWVRATPDRPFRSQTRVIGRYSHMHD
jgi:hypothetical protein